MGEFFPVTRSVRQGCPLSMALFCVYQEPFYRAIVKSRIIRPLCMPDRTKLKLLGYADDTNILINSEESLIEVNNIISQFEQATGARLNRHSKTKIFGLGTWCNKTQWSLVWLKVELQYFSTLGVYYSNTYTDALDKNWSTCINSIRLHKHA